MALSDLEAKWTLYPSLLSQLESERQQHDLEDAVCAGMCGRHEDVDRIFTQALPDTSSAAILALSRADILALHNRELERKSVLKAFKSTAVLEANSSEAIHVLLDLMLEDCNYWLLGTTQPLVNALLTTNAYIARKDLVELTDVDLRCITMFYSATDNLTSTSNFVTLQDKTCFPTFMGDRHAEACAIRRSLESQGRLRFAPTFMQLELAHIENEAQSIQSVPAAMALFGRLTEQSQPAVKYRAVLLAAQLCALLAQINMDELALNYRSAKTEILQAITPVAFPDWQSFCPSMAARDSKENILASTSTAGSKYEQLTVLVATCTGGKSYARANQIYISIRDMLHSELTQVRGTSNEAAIRNLIDHNGREYISFHKDTTKSAFFEAGALCDYISSSIASEKPWKNVLSLVHDYESRHPLMSIPSLRERLLDLGMIAARALGDRKSLLQFETSYSKALRDCHYMNRSGGLASEAVLDPDDAYRVIYADGSDTLQCGMNALHLMLLWAMYESKNGQLSKPRTAILFDHDHNIDLTLLSAEAINDLARRQFEAICGTVEQPTASVGFVTSYYRLLEWLLIADRKPSREVRLDALSALLAGRLYLCKSHLVSTQRALDESVNRDIDTEEAILTELKKLQAYEKGHDASDHELRRVRLLISRCTLPRAERPVADAEIDAALSQCSRHADIQRSNHAWLKEYDWRIKAVALTWQKILRLPSSNAAESDTRNILKLVEDADQTYHTITAALRSPNASAHLVAVFSNANRFTYSEHYRYAFAALYRWYRVWAVAKSNAGQSAVSQEKARQALIDLANWSILAKGQSLMDVMPSARLSRTQLYETNDPGKEGGKTRRSDVEGLRSGLSNLHFESGSESKGRSTKVSSAEIASLVNTADEDVVVIDVLDLTYACGSLGALIYRKDRPVSLVELTISSAQVTTWLEAYLDRQDVDGRTLSSPESQGHLGQLGNLIKAFHQHPDAEAYVTPGATIVWCSTNALYRVPIHAIAVEAETPFIERNPIMYAQSLSLLYHCWQRVHDVSRQTSGPTKKLVINPLSADWESSMMAERLAGMLDQATLLRGQNITASQALDALDRSSLFSFHGHAFFDPQNPLDSAMHLNEISRRSQGTTRYMNRRQRITASDILSTVSLQFPALCTIVACASGVSAFTSNDDVLSIPTALHYAGASSILSTLWPVDDHDGAAISLAFYTRLLEACRGDTARGLQSSQASSTAAQPSQQTRFTNVAQIMQAAVLDIYREGADRRLRPPYHWAGFSLQGLWLLPAGIV